MWESQVSQMGWTAPFQMVMSISSASNVQFNTYVSLLTWLLGLLPWMEIPLGLLFASTLKHEGLNQEEGNLWEGLWEVYPLPLW